MNKSNVLTRIKNTVSYSVILTYLPLDFFFVSYTYLLMIWLCDQQCKVNDLFKSFIFSNCIIFKDTYGRFESIHNLLHYVYYFVSVCSSVYFRDINVQILFFFQLFTWKTIVYAKVVCACMLRNARRTT